MKKDINGGDSALSSATIEKQSTYGILSDAARLLDDRVAKKTQNHHLQAGARRVLASLAIRDGVSQLDLIHATHLKAPTISLIVQKMEHDGVITRKTDDLDMRLTRVFLTEKGAEMTAQILEEIHAVENEAMADFTDKERAVFQDLISRIYINMEASYKEHN